MARYTDNTDGQYRGYLVGLERRHGLLLVSVSPATPDLPILHHCLFEASTQSEAEALSEARYRVDRVLATDVPYTDVP